MKRRLYQLTLVMIMVMALFALTGCGKKEKEQNNTPEVVEQDNTEAPAEAVEPTPVTEDAENAEEAESEVVEEVKEPVTAEDEVKTIADGGLKDVYAQYGLTAGTCLSDAMISQSKYTDLMTKNFNTITLENFMKPDYVLDKNASLAAGEIVVNFTSRTTNLLDWAKANGMKVRGHVMVWHSQSPDWIFYDGFDKAKGLVDRDTMLARMDSYIKQTFEQLETLGYSEIFYAYDVVNEAIMEDGSYRHSLWKQVIGDDYIWHAFNFADKYAPEHIKLYYNDYNEQFKTQHFVKLVKSLVDDSGRYLIDGLGCQAHLYTKDSIDDYIEMLKEFKKLGIDVQLTEIDVSLGTWQNVLSATEENLKAQGQYYYELVNRIIMENKAGNTNVSGITFWGFADNLSWRHDRSPLLFDKDLNEKYAFYGAMQDKAKAGY